VNKDDIRKLEPKYTGNTRHLTEGEAAAIVNDPANDVGDGALTETADKVPQLGLLGANRNP
jgi:hypothetical protein